MRILHTSDWHLGRSLEGRNRLDEQQQFIAEIADIAHREKVDLILIAGDIFDTANPSAAAEQLFYQAIYDLAAGGSRGVVAIAGNHDSPERVRASDPLAEQLGITLLGLPKDQPFISSGSRERVKRLSVGSGWLELAVPGCDHSAVVVTLPYPSEQRLKEILVDKLNEEEMQKSYSERVGAFFKDATQNYRRDTVNLCMSHLFVIGGSESESERPIQLGGACTVEPVMLPATAQYTALGHLHRPQRVAKWEHVRYSGSPLSYSFSEAGQTKAVYIVDCQPGQQARVQEIPLTSGCPLVKWKADQGLNQVLKWCEENRDPNAWIDLTIHVPKPLQAEEIKMLRELRPKLINIRPVLPEMARAMDLTGRESLPVDDLFRQFYQRQNQAEPKEELVQLFLELIQAEREGEDA
ncbi:exonuclease SbcCD subunit D [Peptococcaceae bacterium 1198_IL3148]